MEVLASMLVEDPANAEGMESLCNVDDLFAVPNKGHDCDGLSRFRHFRFSPEVACHSSW